MENSKFFLKLLFVFLLYSLSLPIVLPATVHNQTGNITAEVPSGDFSGDIDTGDALTVIISPAATTTTPAAAAVGGGGVSVVSETKAVSNIAAGDTGTFTYAKSATLGVQEIKVEVKNAVSNVQIKIKESSKPTGASDAIGIEGDVYKYIEVTKTNIEDADVNKVRIKFKVKKTWINDNNIDPDTVVLSRYADGEWNKLPTTKLSEDDDYYYYEAESPGLSVFAITGEKVTIETTIGVTTVPPSVTTVPKPSLIGLSVAQIVVIIVGVVVVTALIIFLLIRFQVVKIAT